MDKEAEQALGALMNVLCQVAREIVLEPGTLVLFDNHRCLHARRSVKQERWLQRLFCRRSLSDLRQANAVTSSSYVFDMQKLLLE
jgi:alpha-ketoglutarate-dependent taurine dioxygenase